LPRSVSGLAIEFQGTHFISGGTPLGQCGARGGRLVLLRSALSADFFSLYLIVNVFCIRVIKAKADFVIQLPQLV
jgi:hypothetical protein